LELFWNDDDDFYVTHKGLPAPASHNVIMDASSVRRHLLSFDLFDGFVGLTEGIGSPSRWNQEEIRLSRIITRHWDSLNQLQILKPSSATKLLSSVILGNDHYIDAIVGGHGNTKTVNDVPQVSFVVDLEGPRLAGQVNVTAFASLEMAVEMNVDYDLNRLENLTISHFLKQGECGVLPALDIRLLPDSTKLGTGKYVGLNLSAVINGRNISLSTLSVPHAHEISSEVLKLSSEWFRNIVNRGIAESMNLSHDRCPGVVYNPPGNGKESGESSSSWGVPPALWAVLVLIVLVQGGVLWIAQSMESSPGDNYEVTDPAEMATEQSEFEECSPASPLLSSLQELIQPFSSATPSKTTYEEAELPATPSASSLDRAILSDIYEQMYDDEEEPQVILEEQLFQTIKAEEVPPKSLFASQGTSGLVPYAVPAWIVATIVLLVTSNLSIGATVDLSIRVNERFLFVPGLFEFSLGNTARDLYHAGIYPLLILVVCFSGIWPYVKVCVC
jgi:hypothetical protein